jgi:hypothetical protein
MGVHDLVDYFNYLGGTNAQLLMQEEELELRKKKTLEILVDGKEKLEYIKLYKERNVKVNAIHYTHTLK